MLYTKQTRTSIEVRRLQAIQKQESEQGMQTIPSTQIPFDFLNMNYPKLKELAPPGGCLTLIDV